MVYASVGAITLTSVYVSLRASACVFCLVCGWNSFRTRPNTIFSAADKGQSHKILGFPAEFLREKLTLVRLMFCEVERSRLELVVSGDCYVLDYLLFTKI